MTASIIVPTYNGASKITSLLNALVTQTYKDFEVIIVIDGSTDHTYETVNIYQSKFQHIKIIQQENSGRAASRNAGAREAKGNIIIFLDDDIVPLDNLVELHIRHHQNLPGSMIVGKNFMDIRGNRNDFYSYRYSIEQKWNPYYPDELKPVTFEDYRFTSSNLSLSKSLFFSLNGFEEQLRDSEDFDFSIRALLKNVPIYYDQNIFGWHCDFVDLEGYLKRQKEYKHSKIFLLNLHPEYYSLSPANFNISQGRINIFKKIISKFFIYNIYWKQVLQSKFFLKLVPGKIRFKLYELIIYSSTLHD